MSLPPGGPTYSPPESNKQTDSNHSIDPPPQRRTGLIVGIVVLVLVLAGAVGAALLLRDEPSSDTQRIDAAIRDFYDGLNTDGPAKAVTGACAQDVADFEALPADQRASLDRNRFTVRIESIEGITVTGDRATATVRGSLAPASSPQSEQASNTQQHLRNEGGVWRVCSADETR